MSEHEYTVPIIGGLLTTIAAISGGLWHQLTGRVTLAHEKIAAIDVKLTECSSTLGAKQDATTAQLTRLADQMDAHYSRAPETRSRSSDR